MKTIERFNIYECFDQNGDPVKYICDGHIDSVAFREKCYQEYFVKPMVIQHGWRKTRTFVEKRPNQKYIRCFTGSVDCTEREKDATPVTIGLVKESSGIQPTDVAAA